MVVVKVLELAAKPSVNWVHVYSEMCNDVNVLLARAYRKQSAGHSSS